LIQHHTRTIEKLELILKKFRQLKREAKIKKRRVLRMKKELDLPEKAKLRRIEQGIQAQI
jgi:hypothetical protein